MKQDPRQFDMFAPVTVHDDAAEARRVQRVNDWELEKAATAAAIEANPPEVLLWGQRKGYSGNYFEIRLLRDGDLWRVRTDYSMPNMGGGGPFGRAEFASRDEALIETLRRELQSIARHVAVHHDDMYGKTALWESKARWCIEQGPAALFGGPDLAAEYQAHVTTYVARNKLRCAACRAEEATYIGEDGIERSITSL